MCPTHHRPPANADRKSTRLNSSHMSISYAVFCLKKKKTAVGVSSDLTGGGVATQHHTRAARTRTTPPTRGPGRTPCRSSSTSTSFFFFFNDTATTEIYTLSLHDALPISSRRRHTSSLRDWSSDVCRLLL